MEFSIGTSCNPTIKLNNELAKFLAMHRCNTQKNIFNRDAFHFTVTFSGVELVFANIVSCIFTHVHNCMLILQMRFVLQSVN